MFVELVKKYEIELCGLIANKSHQSRMEFAIWLDSLFCPVCHGARIIQIGIYAEQCAFCDGTGFRPTKRAADGGNAAQVEGKSEAVKARKSRRR